MAMSAFSTSALSSLEAMLQSLMRGSGGGGGGGDGDGDTPVDDILASPPPPALPARPTPPGRRPSRRRVWPAAAARTLMSPLSSSSPRSPSPSPPSKEQEDHARAADGVSLLLVEELEQKAVAVEARLRRSEEENAALKRRMESYHIRWLQYEIRIKSLEEAFHDQMVALQLAQDAARRAEETASDRREPSEQHVDTSEEAPVRLWPGRDRMLVGAKRSAVSRLGVEFRCQSHTLERSAAALAAEAPAAPSGGPSSSAAGDLKKLKAQFRAWTKDYKARLRRTKAELGGRDAQRQGSCWI